jgi:hypothetical protein
MPVATISRSSFRRIVFLTSLFLPPHPRVCQASLADHALSGVVEVGPGADGAPGLEATLSTDAAKHGAVPFLEKVNMRAPFEYSLAALWSKRVCAFLSNLTVPPPQLPISPTYLPATNRR